MDTFDFVVIGAGPGGEAAAGLALDRGASVALIDRDLFGGSCAYWACMPSKTLLHGAEVHACGGSYPWSRASARRDWMINREGIAYPDDASHRRRHEEHGATTLKGHARLAGRGRVDVTVDGQVRALQAEHIVLAVGSTSRIPPIQGLDQVDRWTNVEGTGVRDLPRSLLIMGGGPTGVELAQVYARYGVSTTIVDSNPRLNSRDHARNSEVIRLALERDGVDVRTGVRAERILPRGGADGSHVVELSDGSRAEAHAILVAVGRAIPLDDLGLETVGVSLNDGKLQPDRSLRIAEELYVIGDAAGPELHTHLAHYQGEMAVRIALGDEVTPDYRAIPRAVYTEPQTGSVGLQLEEAQAQGIDALEETADLGTSAKGYVSESTGHVTIVVDRRDRVLVGAFIAGPGAAEAIHEAVLAVKLRVPLHVLADTMHAFPTTARVMGGLFTAVARRLEADGPVA